MKIISLTSIPSRFKFITPTLESLIRQKGVDEVRLYLPRRYDRFPDYSGENPAVPKGVKIFRVDTDYGPATKLLPAIRDFKSSPESQILFCDDDVIYKAGWANQLFNLQKKRANQAIAVWGDSINRILPDSMHSIPRRAITIDIKYDLQYRIKSLIRRYIEINRPHPKRVIIPGYVDFFLGVAGVVVRPNFFDAEAFNIPKEAWAVDDIWLSAQLAKNNIPIYSPWLMPFPFATKSTAIDPLIETINDGMNRSQSNRTAASYCREKYQIWR